MTQPKPLVGNRTLWSYCTIAALLSACGASSSITVKLDSVPSTVTYDNLNAERKLRITGIVTASSPTTVTALSLTEDGANDATASFVLGSATVTGSAPFSLDWAVPLNEAGVTHKLTLLATPAKGGTEIRTPISIIIDTKAPTITSFSAKSSLSVSGRLEVTFAIEGNTKSVALAVDTVEIPLDPGARTHNLTALTPKKRYTLELRIKGTNGAPATATEQAAPGMVFAKSGAPTANASGSFSKPYATVSAALQSLEEATIPFTVAMAAGTYNVASGETFPLSLGSDRSLSGETNANNELVTIIEGVGERTLELEGPTNVCMTVIGEHTTGSGNSSIDHVKFNFVSGVGCDGKSAAIVGYRHSITLEDSEVLNHAVGFALLATTECRNANLTRNKFRGSLADDSIITLVGKSVLNMRGNDVEAVSGVKVDYDKAPEGPCDGQPSVLEGNRIKTQSRGLRFTDVNQVEIGSFNGQRNHFILDSIDGFAGDDASVIDAYGDNMEIKICDTDIDVKVGPNGDSSDVIRVENAKLVFGDAGGFSSCSSAGTTRINIEAPTMHGIRIVSGAPSTEGGKVEGKSLSLINTASDITTYALRGITVENSIDTTPNAGPTPVRLRNSTIRGFAHNIDVDAVQNPQIILENVCVNSPDDRSGAWTEDISLGTSQETHDEGSTTHDAGVPTASRLLRADGVDTDGSMTLGNSNDDSIANYFISSGGKARIEIVQTATLCFPRPD